MAANPKRYPRKLSSKDSSVDSIHITSFASIRSALGSISVEQEHICNSAFLAERGLFTQMDTPKIASRSVSLSRAFNPAGEAA